MSRLGDLKSLLADRWQLPLALVALITVALTFGRLKPTPSPVPFETLIADVVTLADAGRFHDATNAAANLLRMQPPPTRAQQASLHDLLAEIIYRQELLRDKPILANVRLLLNNSEAAFRAGRKADARAILRTAQAHEWLGDVQRALRGYQAVLDYDPDSQQRQKALLALVRLLDGREGQIAQRRKYIEALLRERDVSPVFLWRVLRHAVADALDADDIPRANDLLVKFSDALQRSDLQGYHDYLWARAMVAAGDFDQAAALLDRVDQWLAQPRATNPRMNESGFLPALVEWLRGELDLRDARPQMALKHFARAVRLQPHGDVEIYSAAGSVRALAALQRDQAARDLVHRTIKQVTKDPGVLNIARPRLRHVALDLADARHAQAIPVEAVAYAQLALELTPSDDPALMAMLERVGVEAAWAAERTGDPQQQQAFYVLGGTSYEKAAKLSELNDEHYANLLWSSADLYDHAGLRSAARRMLTAFVESRDLEVRMPRALLKLGQAYIADGLYLEATKRFAELIKRFPRLEEAAQARLLMAEAYVALGAQTNPQAEQALLQLLEAGDVAPDAKVYHDALRALCELYVQQQRYAEAISRIETFLDFYPDDPDAGRLRFLLADAYRQSAFALRQAAQRATDPTAQRAESRRRFREAADLFGQYATTPAQAPASPERELYERLSLMYQADCLYELNQPGTLEEALGLYRQAAARYQHQPTTLAAQVQIANIYMRQGKLREAASAIERARWLLASIPDQAFENAHDGLDRAWWEKYLATVASAHAFRDLVAAAP